MELMHHEAGVRTVTVGGRPSTGPMQAASGSRGAELYSSSDLDADFEVGENLNATAAALLPSRTEDVFVLYAGINIRDQIRKGQNIPLQFLYEAANCRIFYTPYTFRNLTKLWEYAADAIWAKPELCVQGSTGYASTGKALNTTSPHKGAGIMNANTTHEIINTFQLNQDTADLPPEFAGQENDGLKKSVDARIGQLCGDSAGGSGCGSKGLKCMVATVCGHTAHQCLLPCDSFHSPCGGLHGCSFTSKDTIVTKEGLKKNFSKGYCRVKCDSNSNPNAATPTTPPLPPNNESKPGSGSGGGSGRSRSRGSYKSSGTKGSYVMAGMA